MIVINAKTKAGQRWLFRYENSRAKTLEEVYKNCSDRKREAYAACLQLCRAEGGTGFKIIGARPQFFSVGWLIDNGLRVKTVYNSYIIK